MSENVDLAERERESNNSYVDIFETNKKYNIIYADPPWTYKVWTAKGGHKSASAHYNTMSKEEIQNMSNTIKKISADKVYAQTNERIKYV